MAKIAFGSTLEKTAWGGSEELWSQAALRLIQRGIRVSVNVKAHPELPKRILELKKSGGQIVLRRDPAGLPQRLLRRFGKDPIDSWLRDFKPDLVVISQTRNLDGLGWMQKCIRRRIRFLTLAQGASPNVWPEEFTFSQAREAHSQAAASFFVSQANLELTERQLGVRLKKAKVVRNPFGVPYDTSPAWPSVNPLWKLALVARLDPATKGQDLLFEVLSQEKWRRRPVEVTLFGEGPCSKSLVALRQMLRLENVKFAGFHSDIESIWASHHALILPSRSEGLPMALVEAMLCGRPCIVTDVGGNRELVEDNTHGFLAKAPAKECLEEAMERGWENRFRWEEMGKAAACRVRVLVSRDPAEAFAEEIMEFLS